MIVDEMKSGARAQWRLRTAFGSRRPWKTASTTMRSASTT
jgi:hypothetical protein